MMKKVVRIALIVTLFAAGTFAAEKISLCCGNPGCIPGLNCQK
jgi:hypothetical protein